MPRVKELIGTVTSDKMQKTIIVRIMHRAKHPVYSRIIKRYNKFKVHDEKKIARVGDVVKITATRPLSKEKSYRLTGIVKKAVISQIALKDEVK